MKKLRISCLIVFLAGVLVAGAGLSLMLLEVSAFRYGGEKLIEGQSSDIKTYRKVVDLSALDTLEAGRNGYIPHYCYRDAGFFLVTDAAAGDDAIIEVRYNSAIYEPLVEVEMERVYDDGDDEYDEGDDGDDGDDGEDQAASESGQSDPQQAEPVAVPQPRRASLGFYTGQYNELAEFMMIKDAVMQDFKQRTLSVYDLKKVHEVKITVSPENAGKITGVPHG